MDKEKDPMMAYFLAFFPTEPLEHQLSMIDEILTAIGYYDEVSQKNVIEQTALKIKEGYEFGNGVFVHAKSEGGIFNCHFEIKIHGIKQAEVNVREVMTRALQ